MRERLSSPLCSIYSLCRKYVVADLIFTRHVFPSFLPSFQHFMAFYLRKTRRLPLQITVSGNQLDLSSPLLTAPNCKSMSKPPLYCLCLCCPCWPMEQWNTSRLRAPLAHLLLQRRKMGDPTPRKHTCNPAGIGLSGTGKANWPAPYRHVSKGVPVCTVSRKTVKEQNFKGIIMQMSQE